MSNQESTEKPVKFTIYLTEAQRRVIRKAAGAADQTMTAFIRQAALDRADPPKGNDVGGAPF